VIDFAVMITDMAPVAVFECPINKVKRCIRKS
jgi:hypothetical protein